MLQSSFTISANSDVQGFGEKGQEFLSYPMSEPDKDANHVANILKPETSLVNLTDINPANDNINAELNQLTPHLPGKKRNKLCFPSIHLQKLIEGKISLKEILFLMKVPEKYKITPDNSKSMSFDYLEADMIKTIKRLNRAIDFSKENNFQILHVAPNTDAGKWHFDSSRARKILRAVRCLSEDGTDLCLREDFKTTDINTGKFEVQRYGSTKSGLNVMNKNPLDGCPLHRIGAPSNGKNRWGYIIDGQELAHNL